MNARKSSLLLLSAAIVLSHAIIFTGSTIRRFFAVSYNVRSSNEVDLLMPRVTQLASDYSWIFAVVLALIVAAACFFMSRHPEMIQHQLVLSLCAEALVFWIAMFLFLLQSIFGAFYFAQRTRL